MNTDLMYSLALTASYLLCAEKACFLKVKYDAPFPLSLFELPSILC